jgi:hypothetical protein
MTPVEMCILFSGNVIAFVLIWLTVLTKEKHQTEKELTRRAREKQWNHEVAASEPTVMAWNVASFLGLKTK